MRVLTLVLTVVLASCGATQLPDPVPAAVAAEPPADCASAGPLACSIKPEATLDKACDQLRACLVGRTSSDQKITEITLCRKPSEVVQGPSGINDTGVNVTSVSVEILLEGPPSHATYLFSQREGGWCPAAELMEPLWQHGGTCKATPELAWTDAKLNVKAQRVCRMPLDAEEARAGESDIAENECVRARYSLADGKLKEDSRTTEAGDCK